MFFDGYPPTTHQVKGFSELLKKTRGFLDARGYCEVVTDHLVPAGAFEASIDPLQVSYSAGSAQLHTSAEIEMKRLLADTELSIYQIARCFRDDPPSPMHRREFTMLEFYRVNSGYEDVLYDTTQLLDCLAGKSLSWERHTVRDLMEKSTGVDVAQTPTVESLRSAIRNRTSIDTSPDDTWNDLFTRLLIEKIEPALDPKVPTILELYPSLVSPLSKAQPGTAFAERFEIYWHGMELCNGCTELTDLSELSKSWERQKQERRVRNVEPHPIAQRLFDTLAQGLPPCAGVAMGLERAYLALGSLPG